jgi:hypothetical protein
LLRALLGGRLVGGSNRGGLMRRWAWMVGLCGLVGLASVGCGDSADPTSEADDDAGVDAPGEVGEDLSDVDASDDAGEDALGDAGGDEDTLQDAEEDEGGEADAAPDGWDVLEPDVEPDVAPDLEEPEEPIDLEAPLAAQGEWGPMGQLVGLQIPESPEDARRKGCRVEGEAVGTRLSSLSSLAGGLDQYLRPDAQGRTLLQLLMHLEGWEEGQTAREVREVGLSVLQGTGEPGELLWIDPASLVDGAPRNAFGAAAVEDGWLTGPTGRFGVEVNILGLPFALDLTGARLEGRVYADGPGVGMRRGVLVGYLSKAATLNIVQKLHDRCYLEPEPPGLCGAVTLLLPRGADEARMLGFAASFVGAPDVWLDEAGNPFPCGGGGEPACEGVGVCFVVTAQGVEVEGVGAP